MTPQTHTGEPDLFDVVSVDSGDRWCLMTLTGEFDLDACPRFRRAIAEALERGRRQVAVDAGGLSFMDSSGLVALMSAREEVAAAGGLLRLTTASAPVARLLDMVALADELLDDRR